MKDLVYISGAITGASPEDRMKFHTTAQWLELHQGYRTFNPLDIDVPEADTNHRAWQLALARDLSVIAQPNCIGICALDTFGRSKGALLEIFVAISLGKSIVLGPDQTESWRDHVTETIRVAQRVLWMNVDALRFAHHSDLPMPSDRNLLRGDPPTLTIPELGS